MGWVVYLLVGTLVFAWGCTQQNLPASAGAGVPSAPEKDPRPLYQTMLEWAVVNTALPGQTSSVFFPDRHLFQNQPVIRVSRENLPADVKLSLPNKPVQVSSEDELQKLAEREGQFPALRFTELKAAEDTAELGLDLVWLVPQKADILPLSGGGVRLRFRWQEGAWKFERSRGLRIS